MRNSNRTWRLASRPQGGIAQDDLKLSEEPIPEPGAGEVLVRNIYLSLDPTHRIWMSDMDQYWPPVAIDEVMRGGTLGVVETSRAPDLAPGDLVNGLGGWQDFYVAPGAAVGKVTTKYDVPLPAFLSVLGATGFTAYFGMLEVCPLNEGETVVISAAAGAVGSIAGQIGKIKNCRVVGLAGSDEKCRWLTQELGFDAAINYREANLLDELRTHCPDGIDFYFENVGGEILDAVLTLINLRARIVLCGLIASYNATGPVPGPYMFRNLLMKRARLEGFIVADFLADFPRAQEALAQWLGEGRLKYQVDVEDGLERAPQVLQKLFTGENRGKLIMRISEEP